MNVSRSANKARSSTLAREQSDSASDLSSERADLPANDKVELGEGNSPTPSSKKKIGGLFTKQGLRKIAKNRYTKSATIGALGFGLAWGAAVLHQGGLPITDLVRTFGGGGLMIGSLGGLAAGIAAEVQNIRQGKETTLVGFPILGYTAGGIAGGAAGLLTLAASTPGFIVGAEIGGVIGGPIGAAVGACVGAAVCGAAVGLLVEDELK